MSYMELMGVKVRMGAFIKGSESFSMSSFSFGDGSEVKPFSAVEAAGSFFAAVITSVCSSSL